MINDLGHNEQKSKSVGPLLDLDSVTTFLRAGRANFRIISLAMLGFFFGGLASYLTNTGPAELKANNTDIIISAKFERCRSSSPFRRCSKTRNHIFLILYGKFIRIKRIR